LAEQRRKLLAEIAEDVEADAAKRERELLKQARQILAKLPPIVGELGELLAAVVTVRHPPPGEPRPTPTLAERTRASVDVHAVVDAVEQGVGLLAPAPVEPPRTKILSAPEPEPRVPPAPRRGVSL
jgi:hypothetical protein